MRTEQPCCGLNHPISERLSYVLKANAGFGEGRIYGRLGASGRYAVSCGNNLETTASTCSFVVSRKGMPWSPVSRKISGSSVPPSIKPSIPSSTLNRPTIDIDPLAFQTGESRLPVHSCICRECTLALQKPAGSRLFLLCRVHRNRIVPAS